MNRVQNLEHMCSERIPNLGEQEEVHLVQATRDDVLPVVRQSKLRMEVSPATFRLKR